MPAAQNSAQRPVDAAALQRVRRRLAAAPGAPWLHVEVARRMAERLPVIRLQPAVVLDWWARTGGSGAALAAVYPASSLVRVEPEMPAAAAAPWWSPRRWGRDASPLLAEAAVPAGAGQLLWANMMLHGVPDPQARMAAWHRALAVDGFLMFSTLGPGSLQGLREVYRAQGWPVPHAPFVDMHDLGDMLLHAGFADPVMDQEQLVLTWADAPALLRELRLLGGNADPARLAGLRTPRWHRRLLEALGALAGADGRLRLTFEIVYGHAFRPPPRPRVQAQTTVAVEELRAMARRPRGVHGP
jgi:malonyl-CoA O-methyltransferase